MTKHTYIPEGVCATEIAFEIEGGILHNVRFTDGCDGNSKAVSRLVEGMWVDEVMRKLRGINCEEKGTSCTDQLAKALEEALKASRNK